MSSSLSFDLILLGAGLSNGLVAAACLHRNPKLRLAVVDLKPTLTFEQTWCFHGSDVQAIPGAWEWLQPFVERSWRTHTLRFPNYERTFDSPYHCVSGERFASVLSLCLSSPNATQFLGVKVTSVDGGGVTLASGERLEAPVVLDGRGGRLTPAGAGYQKFVGWEVDVGEGSAALPLGPVLMDATVEQVDGYRFVYVLPLGPQRLLIEDTYFSSNEVLPQAAMESRIRAYAAGAGWTIKSVVRTEKGVLPMPWAEQSTNPPASEQTVFQVGYRGGWFHPATGYSFPLAVAVANAVSLAARGDSSFLRARVAVALAALRRDMDSRLGFYRLLNRLAFLGVSDEDRRSVFERFYRLPEPLVARFYAGATSWWDRFRILGGRPPVPLRKFRLARLMEEAS